MPITTKDTRARISRAAGTRYSQTCSNQNLVEALLTAVGSFVAEFGYSPLRSRMSVEITGDSFGYRATVFESPEED